VTDSNKGFILHDNQQTDFQLLKAAAHKDTDAFRVFMARYQERVYALVYRFTGDRETSRDLAQDIFLKVYRAAGSYTPDAEVFTWLYRIAANHSINFLHSRKRDPLYSAEEESAAAHAGLSAVSRTATQETALEQQERSRMVRRALDSLPPRQKMAITLLRFEGLCYKDISQILECSVSAVESLIFRGMEALKTILTEELKK
jgi:RNA polymerase sigma-70 factor, ECF subfamily